MLSGDNGILQRAADAKKRTDEAEEKEGVELAVKSSRMEDISSLNITEDSLKKALKNQFGNNIRFTVTSNEDGSFIIKFEDSDRNYYIYEDGTIINNDRILEISTAEELIKFRDQVDGLNGYEANTFDGYYVYLKNSITLNINTEWIPIGRYTASNADTNENPVFKGTFDGRGFEINGIKISSTTEKANGFFGLTQNARIKNIKIGDNCNITALQNFGSIVGYANNGTVIENSCNFAEITGTGLNIGGIVGNLRKSSVISCYNSKSITDLTGGRNGGIAGSSTEGSLIKNCYNTGAISGVTFLGGIVGWGQTGAAIEGCFNTANISGTGNSIGGIQGTAADTKIVNCYNKGNISSSNGRNVAGIVGASTTNNIKNSYTIGNISGEGNVGEFYGYNNGTISENNYSKNESFSYSDLGNAFKADYTNGNAVNGGYPILNWQ